MTPALVAVSVEKQQLNGKNFDMLYQISLFALKSEYLFSMRMPRSVATETF